jgi:hypothetical protein
LAEDAVALVLGWPEVTAGGLFKRGDVRVLVVDALGEGIHLAGALSRSGVDAVAVPEQGVAAAAADVDVVVIEALAMGPTGLVAVSGSRAAAAVAHHVGTPVWATLGVGRLLPAHVWEAMLGRLDARGDPWDCDDEVVPLDLVDQVVGSWGAGTAASALAHTDCPIAAELFKGVYAPGTYRR